MTSDLKSKRVAILEKAGAGELFNRESVKLVGELQTTKTMKAENRDELGFRA